MKNGIIQKALSGFYYVDTGDEILTCRARGRFRKEKITPLVGDLVQVQTLGNGEGSVDQILPRKNEFLRPSVANIDQLVIVASMAIPRTEPFLIDRVSAIAQLKNCDVVVCINKCDLEDGEALAAIYRQVGFPTVCVSAETAEGIAALNELIRDKVSAFTGNSGVGKSSILNALDSSFSIKTAQVSDKLGRGKHTTRHVELFRLSSGAIIADTPGFSSFDSEEMSIELKHYLAQSFPDFAPYRDNCKYVGCSHTKEKGCEVLKAVEEGKIPPTRHTSYVRMYEELKDLKEWEK